MDSFGKKLGVAASILGIVGALFGATQVVGGHYEKKMRAIASRATLNTLLHEVNAELKNLPEPPANDKQRETKYKLILKRNRYIDLLAHYDMMA